MATSTGLKSVARFTPAAAAHTARDVLGGTPAWKKFENVTISPGLPIYINTASILIAGATSVTTTWELHLFDAEPTSAIADNNPFNLLAADNESYLGFVTIAQTVDFVDCQYGQTADQWRQIKPRSTHVWGYLVPVSAITTEAVEHVVTLHTSVVE